MVLTAESQQLLDLVFRLDLLLLGIVYQFVETGVLECGILELENAGASSECWRSWLVCRLLLDGKLSLCFQIFIYLEVFYVLQAGKERKVGLTDFAAIWTLLHVLGGKCGDQLDL